MCDEVEVGDWVRLKRDVNLEIGLGYVLRKELPFRKDMPSIFKEQPDDIMVGIEEFADYDHFLDEPVYLVFWNKRDFSIKLWMVAAEIKLVSKGVKS